jgi:hypothetical protein
MGQISFGFKRIHQHPTAPGGAARPAGTGCRFIQMDDVEGGDGK